MQNGFHSCCSCPRLNWGAGSLLEISNCFFICCFIFFQNFTNNFQMGREALSAATAQAAEKAASSVRDFAQKSFRLSMDINLKAPLIIVPQSSVSHNALVMDLGLIKVGNSFSLLPVDESPLPALIDNMDIQLSQLKLSRLVFPGSRKWCQRHQILK